MFYHDLPWFTMIYPDLTWVSMIYRTKKNMFASPGRYLVHSGAKAWEKAEQSYNAAAQEMVVPSRVALCYPGLSRYPQ